MTETLFKYGPAENVSLSMAELAKLKERFGEKGASTRIDRLSLWKAAGGKKTKSDYFTILKWAQRDEERVEALADDPQGGNGNGKPDPNVRAIQAWLDRSMAHQVQPDVQHVRKKP